MDRRDFLSLIATTLTGSMALDSERLLWRPGAKLISIPPARSLALPSIEEFSMMSGVPTFFADFYGETLLSAVRAVVDESFKRCYPYGWTGARFLGGTDGLQK